MPEYTVGSSNLLNAWGNTGAITEPAEAKVNLGWVAGQYAEPDFMNWVHNIQQQKINHALSKGIPLWNTQTAYTIGAAVQYNNEYYRALQNNTNQVPSRGSANWVPFSIAYTSSDGSVVPTLANATNILDLTLPASSLINKFSNSNTISWTVSGSTLVADVKHSNLSVIDTSITLTANDTTKTYQIDASIAPVVITLPSYVSTPSGWYVNLEIVNNARLITVSATGTDSLTRDGAIRPSFYFHGATSSRITISKRDVVSGRFALMGGSDRIGGFVSGTSNHEYFASTLADMPNALPTVLTSTVAQPIDLNNVSSSGFYTFSGITPNSSPPGATLGWLTVYNYNENGSPYIYQQYFDRSTLEKWGRVKQSDGKWSSWQNEIIQRMVGSGAAVSANTLVYSGIYNSLGVGLTDIPPSTSVYGWLTVLRFNPTDVAAGNSIRQEWRPDTDDTLYTRFRNQAGAWSDWIRRW